MNVEDIASKISVFFGIQHDWIDQISGFMFPQVMQNTSMERWNNKSNQIKFISKCKNSAHAQQTCNAFRWYSKAYST